MVLKAIADLDQDPATTKGENAVRAVTVGESEATVRVRAKAQSSECLRRNLISLSKRRILHIRTPLLAGSLGQPGEKIHKKMPVVTKVVD